MMPLAFPRHVPDGHPGRGVCVRGWWRGGGRRVGSYGPLAFHDWAQAPGALVVATEKLVAYLFLLLLRVQNS